MEQTQIKPFAYFYEHKTGDCDSQLSFSRWSEKDRSTWIETPLAAVIEPYGNKQSSCYKGCEALAFRKEIERLQVFNDLLVKDLSAERKKYKALIEDDISKLSSALGEMK